MTAIKAENSPARATVCSIADKANRRPQIMLALVGTVAIAVLWLGLWAFSNQRRQAVLDGIQTESGNLAIAIEEQVRRTFLGIDQTLRFAQFLVEKNGLTQAAADLTQRSGLAPTIGTLMIADETGRVVAFDAPQALDTNIAWTDYFRVQTGPGRTGLFIGRQLLGPDGWVMHVSRRLSRADGSFAGIVAVAVAADAFSDLFESISVGPKGTITLFGRDGYARARVPDLPGGYDVDFKEGVRGKLFETALARVSTFRRGRSTFDNIDRVFARRALTDFPVIVSVGRAVEDALLPVELENRSTTLFGSITSLFIALAFAMLIVELERRRRREAELRTKSQLLETTLESMDQGLIGLDSALRVQVSNRRAVELLELPRGLLDGQPFLSDLVEYHRELGEYSGVDPRLLDRIFDPNGARENHVYERERPNGTVLEIRNVVTADGGTVRTYTDITDRKVAERRIAHLARHDPLTDLPNRRLFGEHLERALSRVEREAGNVALLCLDLDGFKAVNDTLGHPAGDVLLHEVASRLRDVLTPADVVARLGGDEFAIIQVGVEQPAGAAALAERLIAVVNEPFDIADQPVRVGTSIGISLAPKDGTDTEKLLKNADLALYRAKLEGRNVHRFFETEMDAQMQARRALELDLREAIDRDEFELHYQPVVNLATGAVVGCEALIRWRHPVRGRVSPAEFIPIAEEAQLIGAIGQWVLREACREAATWPGELCVAVNLSAAQFRSPGLAAEVAAALGSSGLPAHRLELEITETVVMEAASLDVLHQLRSLGLQIALDDFGTGYSSLSYLRQFPFDRIKIDRSFVNEIANENTAAIVRAIVGLATRLGARITAEGVETEDQLTRVRLEGCTEVQGYLLGRPAPAAEFLSRIETDVAAAA